MQPLLDQAGQLESSDVQYADDAPQPTRLGLYLVFPSVPASTLDIRRGSAIVGHLQPDGRLRVDYEGNLYGASDLLTFAQRVASAAGRHVAPWPGGYPTVARVTATTDALYRVGTVSVDASGALQGLSVNRPDALRSWLGLGPTADLGPQLAL